MATMTQNTLVLNYMKEHGTITALEAQKEFGCMRLASRIKDLKDFGWKICKVMVKVETRYGEAWVARYHLDEVTK